jgi:hypothetical protein
MEGIKIEKIGFVVDRVASQFVDTRSIAAKWSPSGSCGIETKARLHEFRQFSAESASSV